MGDMLEDCIKTQKMNGVYDEPLAAETRKMVASLEEQMSGKKRYEFRSVQLDSGWDTGFRLVWIVENVGFGMLTFYKKDGETTCETEYMSQDFIQQALEFWLNSITLLDK